MTGALQPAVFWPRNFTARWSGRILIALGPKVGGCSRSADGRSRRHSGTLRAKSPRAETSERPVSGRLCCRMRTGSNLHGRDRERRTEFGAPQYRSHSQYPRDQSFGTDEGHLTHCRRRLSERTKLVRRDAKLENVEYTKKGQNPSGGGSCGFHLVPQSDLAVRRGVRA
jgi:hypothetical protein